jgi:Condensation domain
MPSADRRKLAGIERAARITEYATSFNAVVALEIDGNLEPARLRPALDELQRRHPLLGAAVVDADNGKDFYYQFGVAGPIPLELSNAPPDEWLTAFEQQLHQPFDLAAGPLMRCLYLGSSSGGHLIIALHHIIVDGASAKWLVREFLDLCACQTGFEGAPREIEEGRFPSSALYPDRYTGLRFGDAAAAFMARQIVDEIRFRWNSRGIRKAPIFETGLCRLLPIVVSKTLTAALLEASRRERVTLNSILSAAMMAAVQRHLYPSARAPLRHIIFTDLRSHLRRTVPPSRLGCHIGMFRFTVMVERDGDFWTLANGIQQCTLRAARCGERYLSNSISAVLLKAVLERKAFRMAATALSFTGPILLEESYGPFAVTGLHACVANFSLGPEFSALVHLFRDQLWCDVMYLDRDMDEAGARRIAQEMQAILERAAC